MLSKRKRASRCQANTAEHLFHMYKQCQLVERYGSHPILRWLVLSQQYELLDNPVCPMAAANVDPQIWSIEECKRMEQHAVSIAETSDFDYIKYATAFFSWNFKIAELTSSLHEFAPAPRTCSWLSVRDIERSLVVPDVRRSAIKIAQMLEIRAGERETVQNKSYSSALQQLRTSEWNSAMHQIIMYGSATDIYHQGFLDAVTLAIVEGRYRGRLNFLWVDNVVCSPARPNVSGAWPVVYAHGSKYIVVWKTRFATCQDFHEAYCTWLQLCMTNNGIIGGRYDITKCR